MSYILDALKKSDQERKQGEIPGLNSIQDQPQPPRSTWRLLFYLLIGFFLVNILGISLWSLFLKEPAIPSQAGPEKIVPGNQLVQTEQPTEAPVDAVPVTQAAETAKQNQAVISAEPETPAQTGDNLAEKPPETVIETEQFEVIEEPVANNLDPRDDTQEDRSPDNGKAVALENLPPDIQSALPELTISAHYYSNNPAARMASINGRVMRQGQTVNNGLVLDEIIREGVVFTFRRYRFILRVFEK